MWEIKEKGKPVKKKNSEYLLGQLKEWISLEKKVDKVQARILYL